MRYLRMACTLLALALLTACGGSGGSDPGPSLAATPNPLTVDTDSSNDYAVGQVRLSINGTIPPQGIWLGWGFTQDAVGMVTQASSDASGITLDIGFKPASSLALGTHADTIEVVASTDAAGTQQIQNSPLTISVICNVLLPPPQFATLNPVSAFAGGPGFTLTIKGSGFPANAQVRWSGTPLPTTFVSATCLQAAVPANAIASAGSATVTVAAPGMVTSKPVQFPIGAAQARFLEIPASDLAWDAVHQILYASVPNYVSSESHGNENIPYANSIVAIDPATGQVLASVSTGGGAFPPFSGATTLAVSDDGSYLYAFIQPYVIGGSGSVQRYQLPALSLDGSFSIPLGSGYWPMELQVAPGAPHTLALSRGYNGCAAGVLVFDDNVQRGPAALEPQAAEGWFFQSIRWSADASTLYVVLGDGSVGTGCAFLALDVPPTGPVLQAEVALPAQSGGFDLHWASATGPLYLGSGGVLDPATGQTIGHCGSASSMMALDPGLGIGFYYGTSAASSGDAYSPLIRAFDLSTFAALGSTAIPMVIIPDTPVYQPSQMLRCGPATLVLGGRSSPICVVTGPFAQGR